MKKIFLLTIAFAVASCNILDQASPNDVDANNVFISKEGANSALIGLYNTLQSRDYYGGYFPMTADLHSDVGIGGGFDNISLNEISDLAVTPSNNIIENIWLAIYNSIATANAIIEKVPGITDPDFSDIEKNHIVGQAKAIRALCHFDLLRLFGEHWDIGSAFGIPVVLTVQTVNDVVSRNTVAESYAAIITDLNDAFSAIIPNDRSQSTVNPMAVKALLARVKLYKGDMTGAKADAQSVIDDATFFLMDGVSFPGIYSGRLSSESIFELTFDIQNRSSYNAITYSRGDALRTEVLFLAESGVNTFFAGRPGDLRAGLIDFNPATNSSDIIPDGRTQKYRGEDTRDNPAYIIRMAELYLIIAEAKGYAGGGLAELNMVRANRGLANLVDGIDVTTQAGFMIAVLDERKAELNFEGHRMFDLARTGNTNAVLGIGDFRSIMPIPFREITATKGVIIQNPNYN